MISVNSCQESEKESCHTDESDSEATTVPDPEVESVDTAAQQLSGLQLNPKNDEKKLDPVIPPPDVPSHPPSVAEPEKAAKGEVKSIEGAKPRGCWGHLGAASIE